tara:strand:+ start:227 stop:514 length:288 start_codon:yes stop_codon:yes gene_type:complete
MSKKVNFSRTPILDRKKLLINSDYGLIHLMSALLKKEEPQKNHYYSEESVIEKKVNLNDLMSRMNMEKKIEKKNNFLLSAAAISAVCLFGLVLTL